MNSEKLAEQFHDAYEVAAFVQYGNWPKKEGD